MEERSNHLTLIVGASDLAENVRRSLARRGDHHGGVASHLRGLRKNLVQGDSDLVIVCVAMDQSTISRHGRTIRQLLDDRKGFPSQVRSVGLLSDESLSRSAAEIGCDVYVHNTRQALKAVKELSRGQGMEINNRIARRTRACRSERSALSTVIRANESTCESRLEGRFRHANWPFSCADDVFGASQNPSSPPAFD